jgi:hypothetical protein
MGFEWESQGCAHESHSSCLLLKPPERFAMDNLDDCDEAKRLVTINQTSYRLMAFRTVGGFHAVWECGACDGTGYCGICTSVERAFEAAEVEARSHQTSAHPD